MELYEQSLKSIQTFLETGYVDQALQMLGALEQAFPGKKCELRIIKARILISLGSKKEALLLLIDCLEIYEDEDAFQIIKEGYLDPYREEHLKKHAANREIVSEYKNYYGKTTEHPDYIVIFEDGILIVAINEDTKEIQGYKKVEVNYSSVEPGMCFIEGGLFCDQLREIENHTMASATNNGMSNAMLLAYQDWEWDIFLQICDIKSLIDAGRYVFVVGTSGIEAVCDDSQLAEPSLTLGLCEKEMALYPIYKQIMAKRHEEYNGVLEKLVEDYRKDDEELKNRVAERYPKILFFTSKYTTVLQFHSRNLMKAAEKLGCECRILIEDDNLRHITDRLFIETIDDYRPDVIFMLDHFRYEYASFVPDKMLWITWVQDPMDHIMDPATYGKLGKRDIVLNHLFSNKVFESLYHGKMIDAPVPADQEVYRPYDLTDEEKEMYGCDICFVCHASDVENWLDDLLSSSSSSEVLNEFVRNLVGKYRKLAYEGRFFYEEDEFKSFLLREAAEQGYELNDSGVNYLSNQMFMWLNQRVFRQCLVDWIIDAGFTNIKLWGNGWQSEPKYADFAMGPAENGETLSKIYQASKVVVGNNIMTTAAARAWESMLSGAFYLSNVIPEGADWCDIHKIMPEGTVEYFHNREELIDKLHFYLEHDDERKRMAELGRQEALKRMTFEALMKRVLDVLPEYLDD